MKLGRVRRTLAVSTIIANVLMASLVLTLGVLTFIWGSGQFLSLQGSANVFFLTRGEAIRERFIVEDVWFKPSNAARNLTFWVRNTGKLEVTLVGVFVNNSTNTPTVFSKQFSINQLLLVGQLVRVSLVFSGTDDYQQGATYTVIVTTNRGTRAVGQWRFAPT